MPCLQHIYYQQPTKIHKEPLQQPTCSQNCHLLMPETPLLSATKPHTYMQTIAGLIDNLMTALTTTAAATSALPETAAAAAAGDNASPAKLWPVTAAARFSSSLLGICDELTLAWLQSHIGMSAFRAVAEPAFKLATMLLAVMHKHRPTAQSGCMVAVELAGAYCTASAAIRGTAAAAVAICKKLHSDQQAAGAEHDPEPLLCSDATLLLILVHLGLMVRLLQHSSSHQQQQQQKQSVAPHMQLLKALDAAWVGSPDSGCDADDMRMVETAVTHLVHSRYRSSISDSLIGSSSSSGSASAAAVDVRSISCAVPANLQLLLLRVVIEGLQLRTGIAPASLQQQQQVLTPKDLHGTLNALVSLSSHFSSLPRAGSNPPRAGSSSTIFWSVLPAVTAAGLLKPVMQQLSVIVLDTLNSNSRISSSSSSGSEDGQAATTAAAAATAAEEDQSVEDDRRGIVRAYGELLLGLCLSGV